MDRQLQQLISELQEQRKPGTKLDSQDGSTVYAGNLGRALTILHASRAVHRLHLFTSSNSNEEHLHDWRIDLLHLSESYLQSNLRTKTTVASNDCCSVLFGSSVGRHVILASFKSECRTLFNTKTSLTEDHSLLHTIQNSIDIVLSHGEHIFSAKITPKNHGLLYGCSGWLWGLLYLRRTVPESRNKVTLELLEQAALFLVQCGTTYATGINGESSKKDYIVRLPLMYEHDGVKLLGAANGVVGILHVLLLVVEEFRCVAEDAFADTIQKIISPVLLTIEYLLQCLTDSGNLKQRPEDDCDDVVAWCHGAVGLGLLFCKCAVILGKIFQPLSVSLSKVERKEAANKTIARDRYIAEADRCATLILEKMSTDDNVYPGLCYGLAGAGYLFLTLAQITGRDEYQNVVTQFVETLSTSDTLSASTTKKNYSLFEGLGGVVCFMADAMTMNAGDGGYFPCFQLPPHQNA
jgi:hypothetical protein